MINLTFTQSNKILSFIFVGALLQACGGGERTTPYNPSSTSASSSSVGASVNYGETKRGAPATTTLALDGKVLRVMRTTNEYSSVWSDYTSDAVVTEDFNNGQEILIDMGKTDACDAHLNYSSFSANEEGNQSVKVKIKYTETAAASGNCTSAITRPYFFFHISSRKLVIFEEDIVN